MRISNVTAFNLKEGFEQNRFCVTEVVRNIFKRISSLNTKINAYITLFENEALSDAEKMDSLSKDIKIDSCLKGIPLAISENLIEENLTATSYKNSFLYRIKEEGAIILGVTTHLANNPWNIERSAGFTSGGAAAAVASGMAPIAVSLDSAYNIIESAAFCGILGFKPSISYNEKYYLKKQGTSGESIGLFTKNVRDCALLLDALCKNESAAFIENYDFQYKERKIAVIEDILYKNCNEEIKECVESSISMLVDLGFNVDKVTLPFSESINKEDWHAFIKKLFMNYEIVISPSAYTLPYVSQNAVETFRDVKISAFEEYPLLSLPCGFSSNDLPIGLQLAADKENDLSLLQLAYTLEKKLSLSIL